MHHSSSGKTFKAVKSRQPTRKRPDLQADLGAPAIDPNTACIACGERDQPEAMLICDSCQQGHHLACYESAAVPEEDEWICARCSALQRLQPGSSIILESAQSLYTDGGDPHLTQGLFKGVIKSLGPIQQDSTCNFRQVQAEMALAPEPGSIAFYSGITHKRLLKPPKTSVPSAI